MTVIEMIASLVSTAGVAALGWLFKLGPRVSVLEAQQKVHYESLKELMHVKFDDMSRRLDRIEEGLNGALHDRSSH